MFALRTSMEKVICPAVKLVTGKRAGGNTLRGYVGLIRR